MLSGKFHFILWFTATVVHLMLLLAAWDIFPAKNDYPELHSLTESRHTGGSKRAVIFLVGALNASAFFRTLNNMEYTLLSGVVMEAGSWGITRSTDTTTAENIISLLSGTIVDDIPWFNSSSSQPDDLTRYMKETVYIGPALASNLHINKDNWQMHTYPNYWNTYTRKYDNIAMDTWVTEHTKTILNDSQFKKRLSNDKTLFIIYFNGLKVINKYEGKHSAKISAAIERTILNIESLVQHFKTAFNGETLYILAADYSATDIKEYVKEAPLYVATPILTWGAQISSHLVKTKEWPLMLIDRKDINHRDLTALIACILGIPTPAHSVGFLPFAYLKNNLSLIAGCALSNIKQLQTLFTIEDDNINGKAIVKISNFLAPIDKTTIHNLYTMFTKNIDRSRYNLVIDESETLIERILFGIKHYRYYYSRLAKILIVSMYSGWLIYLGCNMMQLAKVEQTNTASTGDDALGKDGENFKKPNEIGEEDAREHRPGFWKKLTRFIKVTYIFDALYVSFSLLTLTIAILAAWPIRLTIYLFTLFCIWWAVFRQSRWFSCRIFIPARTGKLSSLKCCVFLMGLILMCFFFLNAIVLTVIMLAIMLALPYTDYKDVKNCYLGDWMLSSIVLLFSVCYSSDISTNLSWIILQTVLWITLCLTISVLFQMKLADYPLVVLSLIGIVSATVTNCLLKEQIITSNLWLWLLNLTLILILIVGSNSVIIRLIQNGNCLCIPYVLMAKGYEPITYLCIIIHLTTWITVETYSKENEELKLPIMNEMTNIPRTKSKRITWDDERRAFLCIAYLLLCYLALGNPRNIVDIFTNIEMKYNYTNWAPLIIYLIRLMCITVTVTMFYLMITKISLTSRKNELLCLLLLMSFMGFALLIYALAMDAFSTDQLSVSDYIFSQFLILAYLLTYPLNLCLTSMSLLKLTTTYNEPLSPIIPSNIS